jgi:Zn-dependent protease with chaperone function
VYARRENHLPQLKFRREGGNGISTGPLSPRNTIPRDFGRSKKRDGYYLVPLGRYFFFVGSLLLAMLFVADWYLPDSPQSFVRDASVDKSIIRIKSAHRWPERVVIDTSLPIIVPPPSAVLANTPLVNQPREAFAQLDATSQQVSSTPSPAKPKAARKATRTRVAAYREPQQDSMPEVSPREVSPREVLPAGW